MIIDNDSVVKFEDGEVCFRSIGLRTSVVLNDFVRQGSDKAVEMILDHIVSISGLKWKNGEDVTVESLKSRDVPMSFYIKLKNKWFDMMTDEIVSANEKKEQTPASSS